LGSSGDVGSERVTAGQRRAGRLLLGLAWLVTLGGVIGFATFGVNPSLLTRYPGAADVYVAAFTVVPAAQVLSAFVVLAILLWMRAGTSWLVAFGSVYLLSLSSELAGTTWGLPFGEYGYRSTLGPMWLERVPAVIPLSWFYMVVPSYAIARRLGVRGAAGVVVLSAALLTAWDLALDPAMSRATSYWWWGESGPYYGMPWLNLLGWFLTGLALSAVLRGLRADRWVERVPLGWMVSFYGANLFLAMGMSAAAGLWGAVLVTAVAVALLCGVPLALALRRAREHVLGAGERSRVAAAGVTPGRAL